MRPTLLGVLVVCACGIDRSRLEALLCETTADCAGPEQVCCEGVCADRCGGDATVVPRDGGASDAPPGSGEDTDDDGVPDDRDNCPAVPNPPPDGAVNQIDTDADRFGDECDCASSDPRFNVTLADESFDEEVAALQDVSGDWALGAMVYAQSDADAAGVAWTGADDQDRFSVRTSLRAGETGDAGGFGRRAMGALVRARGLDADAGRAYVCGVLLDAAEVFVGVLDLGGPSLDVLASDAAEFLPEPGGDDPLVPLRAELVEGRLACAVTDLAASPPEPREVQIDVDGEGPEAGAAGLFTIGAAGEFGFFRACAFE